MNKIWAALVMLAVVTPAFAFDSADIVRIQIGKRKDYSKEELERRVYDLERAVEQLQRRIFNLEDTRAKEPDKSKFFTCMIKTSFYGTFTATEPTEMAARASVIEKCTNKAHSAMHCDEDDVKCGK